jgi:hypothetical protein
LNLVAELCPTTGFDPANTTWRGSIDESLHRAINRLLTEQVLARAFWLGFKKCKLLNCNWQGKNQD